MQKCRSGTSRLFTQLSSFWQPDGSLVNSLFLDLQFDLSTHTSSLSLETSIPIQASIGVLGPHPCVRDISSNDPSSQDTVRDNGHLPAGRYLTHGVNPQGIRRALIDRRVLGLTPKNVTTQGIRHNPDDRRDCGWIPHSVRNEKSTHNLGDRL